MCAQPPSAPTAPTALTALTAPTSALRLHCPSHPRHPHSNVCPNPLRTHRSQRFAYPLYAVTTLPPFTAHRLHSSALPTHFTLSPPFLPPPLTAFTPLPLSPHLAVF